MNNGQRRRAAKAARKVRGLAGRPHPGGNRESRRHRSPRTGGRMSLAELWRQLREVIR